eukprot:gene29133-35585_t
MLGAFMAMIVFLALTTFIGGVPVVLALLLMMLVAMLLTGLWSWTIERLAYRPLRGSFRLAPLITAIGMSIALSNFVQMVIVIVTAILLAAFWYLVNRTTLGRAQRSCEQDRKMAALLGIDVDKTISMTFVMGAMLAAVAG